MPDAVSRLRPQGIDVAVEAGAGAAAYFSDEAFAAAGASIVADTAQLYEDADVVVKVQNTSYV